MENTKRALKINSRANLEGLIVEFEKEHNGIYTSRYLWEKILQPDKFQKNEMLGQLIPEIGHRRYFTDIRKVSHVLLRVKFLDEGIWGEFNVLDTPSGKNLINYINIIHHMEEKEGISEKYLPKLRTFFVVIGDTVQRDGKKYIDERNAKFIRFDIGYSIEESTPMRI